MDVYMSAVTAPVDPNIEDPCTGIVVEYGDPITFNGSAQGGTAPYSYEWASDVNGLLATEPNFTTSSLNVNYQSDSCVCYVLPHTISLTVTDALGFEATDYIEVTVNGSCADFDHANGVNFEDFAKFALCWLSEQGQENYDEAVDFNKRGIIDLEDLCVLTGEWLQ
jgi:hypothetical protein